MKHVHKNGGRKVYEKKSRRDLSSIIKVRISILKNKIKKEQTLIAVEMKNQRIFFVKKRKDNRVVKVQSISYRERKG